MLNSKAERRGRRERRGLLRYPLRRLTLHDVRQVGFEVNSNNKKEAISP
jgi:hypothetical protein